MKLKNNQEIMNNVIKNLYHITVFLSAPTSICIYMYMYVFA